MHISFVGKVKLALIATLVLVLILSFISLQSLQKLKSSHQWTDHSQLVLRKTNLITGSLASVEEYYTYIITENREGRRKLAKPIQSIEVDLLALKELVKDNPNHQPLLDTVLKYSRLRTEELFSLERKIGGDESVKLVDKYKLNPDYRDRIRESLDEMRQLERTLLASRQSNNSEAGFWTFTLTSISMIFGIAIIISLYYFINKTLKQKNRAENNLRISEKKFSNSFNFSGVGQALISLKGEWIEVNANLCTMLGYSEAEIRDLKFQEITHTDDLQQYLTNNEQILAGKINSYSIEQRYYHKQGYPVWVLLTVSIIKSSIDHSGYFLKQIVDITNTKKITHENQTILDTSIDVICTIDQEGRFVTVNKACKSIWGYEPEELSGRLFIDLVVEDDREYTLQTSANIIAGAPVTNFTNRYYRKDGTTVPIIWSAAWSETEQLTYCIARDGSQQELFEKAIRIEKQRFESLFQQAPSCIAVVEGPDHVFKEANDFYHKMTGKQEMIGYSVREVFPGLESQGFYDRLNTVYTTGKLCSGSEVRADITSDSGIRQELYFDFVYQPYRNVAGEVIGVFIFANDVTEQVIARRKVEESEKRYRQLMEEMPGAVYACDTQGYILVYNKAAAALWGREPVINKDRWCGSWKIYDIDGSQVALESSPMEETIRTGKPVRDRQLVIEQPSGDKKIVMSHPFPLYDSEGKMQGAVNMLIDITESKRAEKELTRSKNIAEQAAVAKSDFLSIMSHEIRTPMNAVMGFTTLLLQNAREDQLEFLNMLKYSSDNLLALINDILDFSKIESGKIEFEKVDYNLKEIIINVQGLLIEKAKDKNIGLKTVIDPMIPEMVAGDPVRLGQILINLAGNAVKFTETGTVTISASVESQDRENTTILFQVSDTGIGIPKDKQATIFDSFTQASSDTTRKYGGTGLGLSICKRLVELQGGEITLQSVQDEGSTFSFRLRTGKSIKPAFKSSVRSIRTSRSLKGTRVLIAEDNKINVMVAQRFLQQWDIECHIAENGLIALQMVQEEEFDLVLMDLHMPEMDGLEATAAIRNLKEIYYHELPIIALTASASEEVKDKVLKSGMNDYITKPFDPDDLYNKISRYRMTDTATGDLYSRVLDFS
ncbi:PAS domain S-box protein [Flavihumibacter sp. R14]|nr:PAS domain S-box protein [Flavihumibacter soli]